MPILALFTGPINKSQYEQLRKEVRWQEDQPKGVLLHVASFDDAGHAHVADVWEDRESLNAFVNMRLMPAMQRHQMPAPSVSIFDTHMVQAYKSIEKYRI